MEFAFFYGPDKIPFFLDEQDKLWSDQAIPFHGIISRGLLHKLEEEGVSSETWYKYAHLIGTANVLDLDEAPDLAVLMEFANSCQVLSFNDSAVAVKNYIEHYIGTLNNDHAICELWNIKEGHTSSVWKVKLINTNSSIFDLFIVNVARDMAASIELTDTSKRMQRLAAGNCPINIAKVYDIQSIKLKHPDSLIEVVVTRNQFIPQAYEIHSINKGNGEGQYVLVERFLMAENDPTRISGILGRKFTADECHKITTGIDSFRISITEDHTEVNVNDGDLVWDGEGVVIVAIT